MTKESFKERVRLALIEAAINGSTFVNLIQKSFLKNAIMEPYKNRILIL